MKIISAPLLLVLPALASALFEEETGLNDFKISTTGHGVPSLVHAVGDNSLISTSDASCTVARRSLDTGDLEWRRFVCTSKDDTIENVAVQGDYLFTSDSNSIFRAWSTGEGALLFDVVFDSITTVFTAKAGARTVAAVVADGKLHFYNALNGRVLGTLEDGASWLEIISSSEENILKGLIGKGGKDVSLVTLTLTHEGITVGPPTKLSVKESFDPTTLQTYGDSAMALTKDGKMVYFSLSGSTSTIGTLDHPLWTSVEKVEALSETLARVTGSDNRYDPPRDTVALFKFSNDAWIQWGEDDSKYSGVAACGDLMVAAAADGTLMTYGTAAKPLGIEAKDAVSMVTVACEPGVSMSILVSTSKLTSTLYSVTPSGSSTPIWTTEDGLSTVSSALIIDPVHSIDLTDDEMAVMEDKLGIVARLEAQVESAMNIVTHMATSATRRDDAFGFVKVAVLLSQTVARIWGVPTTGNQRGSVAWTVDLPSDASWHTMVRGTASSSAVVHGINGGTHSPDVLVLSAKANEMVWTCMDGATGEVHDTGSSTMAAPVAQVVPVFGGGACRQVAVLVHDDLTVTIVPDDAKSKAAVAKELEKSQNGFYGHLVNRETNTLESFTLLGDADAGFSAHRVGQTAFKGETILQVSYPSRDEVVQSPCSILGDDSILLKYLNPHMAVIITMANEEESSAVEDDPLLAALSEKPAKRKPAGATQPGETAAAAKEETPNLFVNVVDTVSGRILHRVSHSNAAVGSKIATLVNENWIMYAFFSEKSRRTELGVLTLYEGMIDKDGLTAFTSPEQVLSFSSLEPRESKPVVLSKTYTIVKPVTALGVTASHAGISTRQVLIASADDRITAVSRHLLEPRRPTGPVKDTEKQEGLFQYAPLVPLVSMASPTYDQTIQEVSSIMSVPTSLESQSLVLAFGGPDLFFSRLSPSKGFDLLPETFNRTLLSMVVVGLLIVLFVVRNIGKKKMIKHGWA